MCLILHRPTGVPIPPEYLERASERNPDGWGIMSTNRGKIKISRGIKPATFSRSLVSHGEAELFVHFRLCTHGAINLKNTHPFSICGGRYAVMHNGVIPIDCPDPAYSDTWHYCHTSLEPWLQANPAVFDDPIFTASIQEHVGQHNKLVILRDDGQYRVVNPDSWCTRSGIWLSNSHSVEPARSRLWGSSALTTWDWRDSDDWDDGATPDSLDDLAGLDLDDLTRHVTDYPEDVARMIQSYFARADSRAY